MESRPGEGLTAKEVGDLAEKGDPAAIRAWETYGRNVGTAIATVCCVVDPTTVVLGGSISQRLSLFEGPLMESARGILPTTSREAFRIDLAKLGPAAGLTGAAEHARQQVMS